VPCQGCCRPWKNISISLSWRGFGQRALDSVLRVSHRVELCDKRSNQRCDLQCHVEIGIKALIHNLIQKHPNLHTALLLVSIQ
jgi:hypothetical protein